MADYSLTAQGRSLDNIVGAGYATFYIPRTTHNAVVGFSHAETPPYGANHIRFGVYALAGFLAWFQDGQQYSIDHPLGTYSGEDEICIEFDGEDVRVYVGDDLRGTFPYEVGPAEELYLAASFAKPDDLIHTPRLVSEGVLPEPEPAVLNGELAPLTGFLTAGGSADAAHLAGELAPLEFFGDAREPLPQPAYLDGQLAPLSFGGYAPPGAAPASLNGELAPITGFLTTFSGAYLYGELAPITGLLTAGGPPVSEVSFSLILQLGLSVEVESISTVDMALGLALGLQVDVSEAETVDVAFGLALGLDFEAVAAETVAFDLGLQLGLDFEVSAASVVSFDLGLQLGMSWEVSSVSTVDLQLGMRLGLQFSVSAGGDDGTEVWVLNVKSGGSTRYTNYPFNSFARIGDQFYGAGQGGLYLLDGPDDAGAEIEAVIDLGRLDFGGSQKKTVAQCYVGMSGEAPLLLSVDAEGAHFVYPTRSYSEHLQQQRVTLGKGLKTNYVGLQLMNQAGADFEVDGVELHVADLTRRI